MKPERKAKCDFCQEVDTFIGSGWTTRNKKKCIKCMIKDGKKTKPLPKFTEKQKSRLASDDQVNKSIWESRPHLCVECNKDLGKKPFKMFFSHLLSKGAHPELRHDPSNIVLHCKACHNKWEFASGFRKNSKTYLSNLSYIEKHSTI